MRRFTEVFLMLLVVAVPSFAKTHKDMYSIPCSTLWRALRDTVRNSGYYQIVWIDNTEMIASFAIGAGNTLRIDSAVLTAKGDDCEMQVQSAFGGLFTNDFGDFKQRVDASLAQLKSAQPDSALKPETPKK